MKLVLDNYRAAPIGEKVRAMLVLLETFTLRPEQMSGSHVRAALAAEIGRASCRERV